MSPYESLITLYRDKCLLDSAAGVLGWDERTYMPPKGSAFRADQMALLAKLSHEKLTSPKIGELLEIRAGVKAGARVVMRPPDKLHEGARIVLPGK